MTITPCKIQGARN